MARITDSMWERFLSAPLEMDPNPVFHFDVKCAADCEPCPDCGEPWCDECEMHYSDCKHPGPNSEDDWIEFDYKIDHYFIKEEPDDSNTNE